jgi:alkylation response protein AidB-like acyl-CoA dehydrogenase
MVSTGTVRQALAGTQLFQKKLADMQTEIALGLQGSLRVGRLMDEGRFAPEIISMSSATIAARRSTSPAWRATCTAATASGRIPRDAPRAEPRNRQHL